MNALQAASSLNWRASVSYMPALCLSVDPRSVYTFNARACLDPAFGQEFHASPESVLKSYGFEHLLQTAHIGDLGSLQLTEEELKALRQVGIAVSQKGSLGTLAFEQMLSQEGYGMPAIAALILVVALGICLFIVVV